MGTLTMQGLYLSLCLALQVVHVVVGENAGLADPDLSKIKFLLWTRQNPTDYDTVELNQESLESSHFDSRHPTIILAHGWNSHGQGFGGDLSEAYLQVGDYNVFAIEWGDLETWANYPQAAVRTRAVGEHSANLVKILSDVGAFDNIHVVGHSLGAHVGGFLAKKVKTMGLGTLKRVTGLDPAEPFLTSLDQMKELTKVMRTLWTSSTPTVECFGMVASLSRSLSATWISTLLADHTSQAV